MEEHFSRIQIKINLIHVELGQYAKTVMDLGQIKKTLFSRTKMCEEIFFFKMLLTTQHYLQIIVGKNL